MKFYYHLKLQTIYKIIEHNGKYACSFIIVIALATTFGCRSSNIGGAGWDEKAYIEAAKSYPTIESKRISVTTENVPYETYKQEFENIFQDFQYAGNPVSESSNSVKTQINGTKYFVSYENFILKVYRDDVVIAERNLPTIFYMHPIKSGAILGKSNTEDIILCRTESRATTGLHYIFIVDGNGEILFEKIMSAGEDWDILPSKNGEIIIGGATTKIIISRRENSN